MHSFGSFSSCIFMSKCLRIFVNLIFFTQCSLKFLFSFIFPMQQDFFRKLIEVFRVCEDLENMDSLHMIFKIIKGISQYSFLCHFYFVPYVNFILFMFLTYVCSAAVLLNSTQIFEQIFSDEFIMDIIGALECKFFTCFFLFFV